MSPLREALDYARNAKRFYNSKLREDGFDHALLVTGDATYRGHKLSELSGMGRRKFENLIVLHDPRTRIKFVYE